MKIRTLPAVLAVVILGFTGAVIAAKANKPPEPPRPGVEQSDHGREHVDSKKYGGDQPPTSGAHANPVSWGVYDTEVRDDQLIHNMEHGGIYISYQPSLPKETYRDWETDRKSTRLNSSHITRSRMPSSA